MRSLLVAGEMPMRALIPLVLGWCSLDLEANAQAPPDPAHIAGMPSVERVLAEIEGRDARDTALRQIAAFTQLRDIIEKASDGRVFVNRLGAGEKRLMTAYGDARSDLTKRFAGSLSGAERTRWVQDLTLLERSDDYRDEILGRLFTADWANWYLETTIGPVQARRRNLGRAEAPGVSSTAFELTPSEGWTVLAIVLPVPLLLLGIWRERRPFGADPNDPNAVVAGFKRRALRTATGTLTDVHEVKTVTTRYTPPSDGHMFGGRWSRGTEITLHFTLRSPQLPGGKLAFDRFPAYPPIHDGEVASIAWLTRAMRAGNPSKYVLFRNHTQRGARAGDGVLQRFFRPRLWPALPIAWTVLVASLFTGNREAGVALAILAFVGYLVWRFRAARRRAKTYLTTHLEPLLSKLDDGAASRG